jgi:hypothetical protein
MNAAEKQAVQSLIPVPTFLRACSGMQAITGTVSMALYGDSDLKFVFSEAMLMQAS